MRRKRGSLVPSAASGLRARLAVELLEDRQLLSAGSAAVLPALAPTTPQTFPDYAVHAAVLPNDPSFTSQYALYNTGQLGGTPGDDIHAAAAWNVTTGSMRTVVAVIDSGIDYDHIDLYQNIWLNQAEIPRSRMKNLVDVDGDGLITFRDLSDPRNQGPGKITDVNHDGRIDASDILAPMVHNAKGQDTGLGGWAYAGNTQDGDTAHPNDFIGWNFINNTNDPFDDNGHGTHVAGILGARGNNSVGVAGVDWNVQLMDLKFLNAKGNGDTNTAVLALNYAVAHGAPLSNNSWGGSDYSQALFDAINSARSHGHIFVTAAGNGDANGVGQNNDTVPEYPARYGLDNIIAVAATDHNDQLASFSNYGPGSVSLAAPGVDILSTTPHTKAAPDGTYTVLSGTSMATPFVTGVLALVESQHPGWAYTEVIDQVLNNVDPVAALADKTISGGRLDAAAAVGAGQGSTDGPHVVSAIPNATGARPVSSVRLTFSAAIDPSTFTPADVRNFTGPHGAIRVTAVRPVAGSGGKQFDVTFLAQSAPGNYQFEIGPDIRDLAGNLLDQNGNSVNGENPADTFTAHFTIARGATFTDSAPARIRGLSATVSTITVDQDVSIADLTVKLNINFSNDSLLYIYLHGPDGTNVVLTSHRGGSGHDFADTVFDDGAATPIGKGTAPFAGLFRAEDPLSAFAGKNARGTWQLWVEDRGQSDLGSLNSWSLTFGGALAGTAKKGGRAGTSRLR